MNRIGNKKKGRMDHRASSFVIYNHYSGFFCANYSRSCGGMWKVVQIFACFTRFCSRVPLISDVCSSNSRVYDARGEWTSTMFQQLVEIYLSSMLQRRKIRRLFLSKKKIRPITRLVAKSAPRDHRIGERNNFISDLYRVK